ncbi:homoserine kinase [Abditibacteriota bacterium]|nr:homoserine kinase [Abditibacteriota bacterium]
MSNSNTHEIATLPSVVVEVPATTANCGPGFDCLGVALSLFNRLELRPSANDELSAEGEGESALQGQSTSLAHRAARAAWDELGLEPTGFSISMRNMVPFARGLGSSSAAIVGGLLAANEWARAHRGCALSEAQLLDLATHIEGHPDNVAPALKGSFCVCATREDGKVFALAPQVRQYPLFVVWIPEVELSTEKARAALPSAYLRADCVFNLSRAALLVAALSTGDFEALAESVRDHVHQDYRSPLVPGWDALCEAAHELGALGTTLSGAGPTILFWLSPDKDVVAFIAGIESTAKGHNLTGRALELTVGQGARLI